MVLALRYENQGRSFEAYRFGDEGYYDAEGEPLRKMFLRSPLPYSRVTSRFSHSRFHPILKRYRPHYGVDYAAPRGTPVRVTANGVVTQAAWSRGGGKTVSSDRQLQDGQLPTSQDARRREDQNRFVISGSAPRKPELPILSHASSVLYIPSQQDTQRCRP